MKYLAKLLPIYRSPGKRSTSVEIRDYTACQYSDAIPGWMPKPHQELPIRYLAPHTPYRLLLLIHDPGSGKTFVAYALISYWARLKERSIVLSQFPTAIRDHLFSFDAKRTHEAGIKDYVEVLSFSEVEKLSNGAMQAKIGNAKFLVLDETHTVYNKKNSPFDARYQKVLDFCELFKQRKEWKFLNMTATPQARIAQVGTVNCQITQLVNLMDRVESLDDIRKMKGLTSIYRMDQTYVEIRNMGKPYVYSDGTESTTKVVVDVMRGYQLANFKSSDDEIFCAPEGATDLRENLWQYSALFYKVFESMGLVGCTPEVAEERAMRVTVFYSDKVMGEGGNRKLRELSKNLFNLEEIIDVDEMLRIMDEGGPQKKRMCFVSGTLGHSNDAVIAKCMRIVSHPSNMYAQHCWLLIISNKGSTGYNLTNVRNAHFVLNTRPAISKQAMGRCFRGQTPYEGDENFVEVYVHLIDCPNRVAHLRMLESRERVDESVYEVLEDVSIEKLFASEPICDSQFIYDSLYDKFSCKRHHGIMREVLTGLLANGVYSMPLRTAVNEAMKRGSSENDSMYALTRIIKIGTKFGEFTLSNYMNVLYFRTGERKHPLRHILNPIAVSRRRRPFEAVMSYFKLKSPITRIEEYVALPILAKMYVFEACFTEELPMTRALRLKILAIERGEYTVEPGRVVHGLLPHYHSKQHAIYVGGDGEREFVDGVWRNVAGTHRRIRAPPNPPPAPYPLEWFFETVDGVTKRYTTQAPGKGQSISSIRTEDKMRYVDGFLGVCESVDRLKNEWPDADWSDPRATLMKMCNGADFFIRLQRATTGYKT